MCSGSLTGLLRLAILCLNIYCSFGKKCLKNDDIGWRPENIYECTDPTRPECCEKDRQFTCCEYNRYKNVREQFQLWGTVLVFCLILCVVYLYFTRDSVPSSPCICTSVCTCFTTASGKLRLRKRSIDFHNAQYQEDYKIRITSMKQSEEFSNKL